MPAGADPMGKMKRWIKLEGQMRKADLDSSCDCEYNVLRRGGLASILAELLHRLHLVKLLESSLTHLILHSIMSCHGQPYTVRY